MDADILQILDETLAATQEGLGIFDPQDRIIFCNAAFAHFYDMTPERILGMSWADSIRHAYRNHTILAIDTDDIEAWLQRASSRRRLDSYRTFEIDTRDGRWFLCAEYCHPSGHLVFHATENTRQKRLELELIRTKQQLEELASRDDLTGLYNRRHFLEELRKALITRHHQQAECTLLMIDLDFFKSINDEHGHATGDQVLQEFSRLLPDLLRPYDQAARIGGEEFAVLLPDTGQAEGEQVAERLRDAIARHQWPDMAADFRLTLSIGGAGCRHGKPTPDHLLNQADKALYTAKSAGRNRVAWATA